VTGIRNDWYVEVEGEVYETKNQRKHANGTQMSADDKKQAERKVSD